MKDVRANNVEIIDISRMTFIKLLTEKTIPGIHDIEKWKNNQRIGITVFYRKSKH